MDKNEFDRSLLGFWTSFLKRENDSSDYTLSSYGEMSLKLIHLRICSITPKTEIFADTLDTASLFYIYNIWVAMDNMLKLLIKSVKNCGEIQFLLI